MKIPPLPVGEDERQAALDAYRILDTDPEQAFEDLVKTASYICGVPTALISLAVTCPLEASAGMARHSPRLRASTLAVRRKNERDTRTNSHMHNATECTLARHA